MKKILTESEKNRILDSHIKSAIKGLSVIKEQVVQGTGKDPYQYKKEGEKYFYAKKSKTPIWKQAKNQMAIDSIKSKIYNEQPIKKPLNLKSLVGKTVLDHSGEKNGVILSVTQKKTNCPDNKPVYEIKIRNLNGPSLYYYYYGGGDYWFASSGGFEDNDIILCDLSTTEGFRKFKSVNLQQLFGF
jgi:hypothetical protein